jgi:hypothetical protein
MDLGDARTIGMVVTVEKCRELGEDITQKGLPH